MIFSFRNVKGSVTPALCIVLSVVILLNFIMLDCLKIIFVPNLVKKRQELGVRSAMSFFYRTLQEDYGLYGVHCSDFVFAEKAFKESLSCRGDNDLLDFGKNPLYAELKLMDYDIGETGVLWKENLGQINVLEDQIYDVMKYKAAGNAVGILAQQLKAITGLTSMTGVYGKYTLVSAAYDEYKSGLSELYRYVNGDTDLSVDCVNGICRIPICQDEAFVRNLNKIILPQGSIYDEKQAELLKSTLKIYSVPAEILADANMKTAQVCEDLTAVIDGKWEILEEVETWIDEYEPEEEYEFFFIDSMEKMIKEIKNGLAEVYLNGIKNTALENRENLIEAGSLYLKLSEKIVTNCVLMPDEIETVTDSLSDAYKKYKTIMLPNEDLNDEGDENYKKYLLNNKSNLAEQFNEENTGAIPNGIYNSLPSVLNCSGYKYYLHSLDNVNSTPDNAFDIANIMENCDEIGALITAFNTDISGSVMTDLYIIEYFNCDTDDYNVDESNDRFLEYEIEYILSGSQKEYDNVTDVYARLIELRTGFNTVHIICDKEKMDAAQAAGRSLSALSGEIGAPVYTAMVIASWAFSEAMYDVHMLENGKTVPLIKKKGDWITSVDGLTFGSAYNPGKDNMGKQNENEITDSEDVLSMDYKEYLTLLLMQVPETVKLYRIQDVLELNLYKASNDRIKISDFYTMVSGSVLCIFDTFMFVEDKKRQYSFSAEVSYGI